MNLVNKYMLQDIKDYELKEGINLISYFEDVVNDYNIIELIRLGNGKCSIERACEMLDQYMSTGKNYIDALLEIKECLIGVKQEKEEEKEAGDGDLQTKDYKNLTDLYMEMCMQLMSVGVSYSEFWSMSTADMYRVFSIIEIKILSDMQKIVNLNHNLAGMIGGAVWGKLDKEAPKLKGRESEVTEYDTAEFGVVDSVAMGAILALSPKLKKK